MDAIVFHRDTQISMQYKLIRTLNFKIGFALIISNNFSAGIATQSSQYNALMNIDIRGASISCELIWIFMRLSSLQFRLFVNNIGFPAHFRHLFIQF